MDITALVVLMVIVVLALLTVVSAAISIVVLMRFLQPRGAFIPRELGRIIIWLSAASVFLAVLGLFVASIFGILSIVVCGFLFHSKLRLQTMFLLQA